MKVKQVREAAADWVRSRGSGLEQYCGAYISGSTVGLPDDADMPIGSDIDVMVVLNRDNLPMKPGKLLHQGVLVEISFLALQQLSSPEAVLSSYHLAGGLRTDTIIDDPTGYLRKLQSEVSRHFAQKKWVRARCEHVLQSIQNGLSSIPPAGPWHAPITSWLFPTGITTHVILVAALRNPTVRLRYLAASRVLAADNRMALYEKLLRLLGCETISAQRVEQHLQQLERTFDTAAAAARTLLPFSSDITAAAKPIIIDGSRVLIKQGNHREAVFWMMATFARCHHIFTVDQPELLPVYEPSFREMAADLGIYSFEDMAKRARQTLNFLPELRQAAEQMIQASEAEAHRS
ncbi:hypothetical protein [Paenibacillus protaetiae]|uniref:Polymerase nucleotidyl transferase domain-containing protein n=1 Tax=Paenibacillus protaetiae TaxID=2509456 RepID=A0A4V0YEY0_9BACL|nr:hypothetical protein [Paenibacillus protaetiae]QAY65781.1 hypothetical protein ET464_04685 [Paenibacillus protaetiae]